MEYLATVLGTVLVMLSGFWLWEHYQKQGREIEALKADIQKLKSANRSNLPYNTAEDLEHLLAAVIVLEQDMEIKTNIIGNIRSYAELARANKRAGSQT